MSSHEGFAAGLIVPIQPSPIRLMLTLVVHSGGLFAIYWNSQFSELMSAALVLAIVLSFITDAFGSHFGYRQSSRVVQLQFAAGQWRGSFGDGSSMDLNLEGLIYVGRWFLVMRFARTGEQSVLPVIIGRDTVSPDTFRRMSVILRYAQA